MSQCPMQIMVLNHYALQAVRTRLVKEGEPTYPGGGTVSDSRKGGAPKAALLSWRSQLSPSVCVTLGIT